MKNTSKVFCCAIAVLLLMSCLFSIAVSASAAQADPTVPDSNYKIRITCSYSDVDEGDVIDPSTYEKNVFLFSSKDSGLYAIAEYREGTQSYQVVGYTENKTSATPLRCGMNQGFPGELRITGIPEGSYFLTHIETQDEYTLLTEAIDVTLSSGNTAVDGRKQTASIDPHTGESCVTISIQLSKDFDLPLIEKDVDLPLTMNDSRVARWSYNAFGFDISVLLFCIVLLGSIACLVVLIHLWRKNKP